LAAGARIRKLCEAAGLSQEGLAEAAGLHRTYVGGIERGERNPTLRNLHAIANALDLTLADLLKGVDR
jgi:transcriptional regulator with XRE-family HTH domain